MEEAHNQTVGKIAAISAIDRPKHSDRMHQVLPQITVARQEASLSRGNPSACHSAHSVPAVLDLAHELRQPLGVIESLAFYLELTSADEKVCQHLQRIQVMVFEANRILELACVAPKPLTLDRAAC